MTEQNAEEAVEEFEPRTGPSLGGDEEVSIMPVSSFLNVGVEEQFCELACKTALFAHDFPELYKEFIESHPLLFAESENNIFSLSENFPHSVEDAGDGLSFETDLLIVDLEEPLIMDGENYGTEAIAGIAVNASNGTSFTFYLNQIEALQNHVIDLDHQGLLGDGVVVEKEVDGAEASEEV